MLVGKIRRQCLFREMGDTTIKLEGNNTLISGGSMRDLKKKPLEQMKMEINRMMAH